jgi:hypothetical protein
MKSIKILSGLPVLEPQVRPAISQLQSRTVALSIEMPGYRQLIPDIKGVFH